MGYLQKLSEGYQLLQKTQSSQRYNRNNILALVTLLDKINCLKWNVHIVRLIYHIRMNTIQEDLKIFTVQPVTEFIIHQQKSTWVISSGVKMKIVRCLNNTFTHQMVN